MEPLKNLAFIFFPDNAYLINNSEASLTFTNTDREDKPKMEWVAGVSPRKCFLFSSRAAVFFDVFESCVIIII